MEFEDLDLPDSPYQGYYINRGGRTVSIDTLPLISHIKDNLYVGGCIEGVKLKNFFSHVFSMYKWEKYHVDPFTKVHTVTMYDSNEGPDRAEIDDLAWRVAQALKDGGNVLVHCQAGINRSNLVAAAALVKLGYTVTDAIALLRKQRSNIVLANQTFEKFLLESYNSEQTTNPSGSVG